MPRKHIHTDTYAYITAGFNCLTFDSGVVTTWTEENLAKDSDEVNGLRLAGGYNNTTSGIVTDKDVYISDGVVLSGNDTMPFYVQKRRKV